MRDHPLITVFAVAFVARGIVAIGVFIIFGGTLFLDDGTYSAMASQAADGTRVEWDAYTAWLYHRTGTFLVPLTLAYKLFGPVLLAGQLIAALFGAAAAVATSRLAREVLNPRGALLAGLAVALLPSQVLWSSLILKDAAVWAVVSGLGLTVAVAGRLVGLRLAATGVAAAMLLVLLAFLRLHTLFIAGVALFLASWMGDPKQRIWRILGTGVIVVAIPWLVGAGPAGTSILVHAGNLDSMRSAMAAGGNATVAGLDDKTNVSPQVDPAPSTGNGGIAPRVPQTQVGAGSESAEPESVLVRHVRHLPYGLAAMLLEPVPWRSGSTAMRIASIEVVVWYPLLAMGLLGMWQARRHLRVAAFPVLFGGASLLLYALTEGNIGTAFRHRGEFVWVVCFLAALGVASLRHWPMKRVPDGSGS